MKKEDHEPSSFTVYPNPAGEVVYVELDGTEIAQTVLYDLQGRMVYSQAPQNSPAATLNLRNLPAGVYLLRVTDTDGKEYRRKIIKN